MPRPTLLPWRLRVLVQRPMTLAEELMEVLARDGEAIVSTWARRHRRTIRRPEQLFAAIRALEAEDGPVAWSLAGSIRRAWRGIGGAAGPTRSVLDRT